MGWVAKGECNDGAKQRRKVKGFVVVTEDSRRSMRKLELNQKRLNTRHLSCSKS